MNETPTFRPNTRPELRIALSHLNGSPRALGYSTPMSSGASTPYLTPFPRSVYSPLQSIVAKSQDNQFEPGRRRSKRNKLLGYSSHVLSRIRRLLRFKIIWLVIVCLTFSTWLLQGDHKNFEGLKEEAVDLRRDLLLAGQTRHMQFYPASNPLIHVGIPIH